MARRRTRGRNGSPVKNSRPAKNITENIGVNDMYCEIVLEGTQSTSSSQKPPVVKRTPKSKEFSGGRSMSSKVNYTPVTGSAGQIKGNVGTHSPQVTTDPQGCIVVDKSSLVVTSSTEPDIDVVYENTKKRKNRQWTLEDTKKFYASLGTVQTDFSLMSHLFNNSRSRHELKLKFKLEEKKNKDLIDKALSSECNMSDLLSDKFDSGLSANQNSTAEELSKSISEENKTAVQQPKKKSRRARKFYFSTNSDEEDVQVINKKGDNKAGSKQSRKLALSSQPPLSKPAEVVPLEIRNDAFQSAKQNTASNCAAYVSDNNFTSGNGFNIRRPTVVRTGENGRRQAFDARVILNAEDNVVPLVNTEDIPQTRFNGPEVLPQGISDGTRRTMSRHCKSSVSYSFQNSTDQKISQKKPHGKVCGDLDVVKLLLGHLEGVDVLNTRNEVFLLPESESNVLKLQNNSRRSKRGVRKEIHDEESDVEVVYETVRIVGAQNTSK